MTEPRIQYAKTKDGVSIAYATLGQGTPPLVLTPLSPLITLHVQWQIREARSWYERLAGRRMLVRYDGRGCGLSEQNVTAFSGDTLVLDLASVADHLNLEVFSLLGRTYGGLAAIAYAVANPERVSRLILWNACARGADYWEAPRQKAYRAMREADWATYTETLSRLFIGSTDMAAHIRQNATPEVYTAFLDAIVGLDVNHMLPLVRCPTLVLHMPARADTPLDTSRSLASHIPGARFAVIEGDVDAIGEAIEAFLDEGGESTAERHPATPAAVHTVLFTDVEGSTALTDRLGDARARDLLRDHERMVREALKSHGGSEVKALGDGFMASFSSATKALECAIAIQRAFAGRNESAEEPILVRVGLNAGEPIAENDPGGRGDLFGTAVNMAARIASKAQGGEILVADVVRQLVAGKDFLFSDRGDTELRGFEDPVRVYEVRWREGG